MNKEKSFTFILVLIAVMTMLVNQSCTVDTKSTELTRCPAKSKCCPTGENGVHGKCCPTEAKSSGLTQHPAKAECCPTGKSGMHDKCCPTGTKPVETPCCATTG